LQDFNSFLSLYISHKSIFKVNVAYLIKICWYIYHVKKKTKDSLKKTKEKKENTMIGVSDAI